MANRKGLPWFKFFPGDWIREPKLRRCSLAAQGVWINLICLSYECEEVGVFSTAGQPWPDRDVAAAVGGDIAEILRAIDELIAKRVLERSKGGSLMCPRVVRDEEFRRKCSVAGKKGGGNPSLKSTSKGSSKASVKEPLKAPSDSDSVSEFRDSSIDSNSEEKPQSGAPPGCADGPAFSHVPRTGRLTFDRRMMPVPTSHVGEPFEPAWNRWLNYRIEMGTVTTEDTARGCLVALCKLSPADAAEVIRRTIEEKGWTTLDLPKRELKNERHQRAASAYTNDGFKDAGDSPI